MLMKKAHTKFLVVTFIVTTFVTIAACGAWPESESGCTQPRSGGSRREGGLRKVPQQYQWEERGLYSLPRPSGFAHVRRRCGQH